VLEVVFVVLTGVVKVMKTFPIQTLESVGYQQMSLDFVLVVSHNRCHFESADRGQVHPLHNADESDNHRFDNRTLEIEVGYSTHRKRERKKSYARNCVKYLL
jgi:hypothetical protein